MVSTIRENISKSTNQILRAADRAPNQRGRDADDNVKELCFEDDNPPPRSGDPRVELGERDPEISPQRAFDAGFTGGEVLRNDVDNDVTGDDLSPETLFDEDAVDNDELITADKDLRIVDESEIGGGIGLDEAELAQITGRPD